jgi:hypothetical protein
MKLGIILTSVLLLGFQAQAIAYSQVPGAESRNGHHKFKCNCDHKYTHARHLPRKRNHTRIASRSFIGQRDDGFNDYQGPAYKEQGYSSAADEGYMAAPTQMTALPSPAGNPNSVFNFYGPTTNFFGPPRDFFGPAARYPSYPDPSMNGDRMDPWHGYDPYDGLENGY